MPSCQISWSKNVNENEKAYSYLMCNIVSLGEMDGKTEPSS